MLKHHIGLQHTNANCEICDKVVLKSSLNAHKKTHQENAFKCESCDKVYNRKNNLENHRKTCGRLVRVLRKEVTDIFNCDECHKDKSSDTYGAGLHKLWYPGIPDTSTWSKFGAHGEHGDVFLFSNLGAL